MKRFLFITLVLAPLAVFAYAVKQKDTGAMCFESALNVEEWCIDSSGNVTTSGLWDVNGTADGLVLDADGDTTVSADTDDQINIELASVDHFVLKKVATADSAATTNLFELAFTSPVDTTGTNTHQGMVIDAEIGNATGGTNVVNLFEVDAITGDAEVTLNAINVGALTGTGATETAILVGTGWDLGLDLSGTQLDLDADNDTSITASTDDQIDFEIAGTDHVVMKAVAGADGGATTNIAEIAFTSPVDTTGTNTHQGLVVDAEIGNASGGTNVVNLIEVDALTGDAEVTLNAINVGALTATGATETAVVVGTGWDIGLDLSGTQLDLDADNDTSIVASTDDQIDIEVAGANDFQITANDFSVLSGSTLNVDSGGSMTVASGATATVSPGASLVLPYEIVTSANVITTAECGTTYYLNSATEFASTLPAVSGSAGCTFRFIVKAAPATDGSYNILSGNSKENVFVGHVETADIDGAADGDSSTADDNITIVQDVAAVGDMVELWSDGVSWYYLAHTKIYNGITAAQDD